MNRTVIAAVMTAGLSATLGVSSLAASDMQVANIPFAFQVKSQTMPAGRYQVRRFSNTTNAPMFTLSSADGHTTFVNAPVLRRASASEAKLTFTCYRSVCSLTNIDPPASDVSYGLVQHNSTYTLGLAPQVEVRLTR